MRILPYFCVTLLLISSSLAQGHFPLHIGDLWQYVEPNIDDPWSARILSDTILSNGHSYAVCDSRVLPRFLRELDSKVFAEGIYDSTEYVLFDFTLSPGDTVSKHEEFGQRTAIVVIDTSHLPSGRRGWTFAQKIIVSEEYSYEFIRWILVDSLGVTNVWAEPGYEWVLQGAIIDGVQYGIINLVSPTLDPFPTSAVLRQNYPNPFNPTTRIAFMLSRRDYIQLKVYDANGREVSTLLNRTMSAGDHSILWNAGNSPSGIYFCRLTGTGFSISQKMVLVR